MHRLWLERLGGRPRPEGYSHRPSSGMALTSPTPRPTKYCSWGYAPRPASRTWAAAVGLSLLFDQVRLWAYR